MMFDDTLHSSENSENDHTSDGTGAAIDTPESSAPQGTEQNDVEAMRDQLLRALAEVENMRKRSQREREDAQKFGATRLARDLLSVADNLKRALASMPDLATASEETRTLIQGVSMIEQELMGAFRKAHILSIDALHQKFDATLHQAITEIETAEHAPGTVVEVVQEGYQLHDRLLRPAMVVIAKAPSQGA